MIQHELRKRWGEGTLSIAFDDTERALVAAYEHDGNVYGPVKIMDLPSTYDTPQKLKWAVKEMLPLFDSYNGGDDYFTTMFGPEAGQAAYGDHRTRVSQAKHMTHEDAVRIAEELLMGFYNEAKPGATPFDNWAMLNRLNARTFGRFGDVDRLMRILEEADDRLRKKFGGRR